ncbi:Hypothetical predicted protein [Marmota monax]|uniref:Uncharacterized protein n=1 Tax=Marmota monax TaxID=9995 RepID=A0A5E4B3J8_MARMO|nr:Hypothetical predicted protein [Marmota monax]
MVVSHANGDRSFPLPGDQCNGWVLTVSPNPRFSPVATAYEGSIHVSSALPSDPEQTAFRQFTAPCARAVEDVGDLISLRLPPCYISSSRFLEMKPCRRRLRLWAALTGAALICDRSRAALASAALQPSARPLGPKRLPPRLSVPLLRSTGPLAGGSRTTPEQALPEGAAANRPPRLEPAVQPSEDRAWPAAQLQPLGAAAGQCIRSRQDSKQKANGGSCGVDFRHRNHSPANNPNPQTLPV